VKKLPQTVAKPIFWEKISKNVGYFVNFFKKLPKVINHPKGENSHNLVTLQTSPDRFFFPF
jgi:hypothetical protein